MNIFKRTWNYLWHHKWLLSGLIIVIIVFLIIVAKASHKTSYQFVTVSQGNITETVTVTGNTTSTNNVSLAFQSGGTIANVFANIGDHVTAGETIATENTSGLQAQLAQAQASVDAAQAQLNTLLAGPTTQNIQVSQAALAAAEQSLVNAYANVPNVFSDSLSQANDAVRNQLAPFFTGAETSNPQLTFNLSNSQTLTSLQTERLQASTILNTWNNSIASVTATTAQPTLDAALQNAAAQLVTLKQLFATAADALSQTTGLSAGTAATYQADEIAGANEVNTAATNIATLAQTIATDKAAVAQAQAQLNLTSASSTPEAIAAQQAQVEEAQANEQNINVSIANASIVSPINGTITEQNAQIGEIASPGVPLVSILGNGGFEVDAYVAEVDVGKLAVGDPVSMTLDAFPGQSFNGTVSYIDPAETDNQGVVGYLTEISFAQAYPDIRSGFTVNCDITAETKTNILTLPQYAIIQSDAGTFVETVDAKGNTTQIPVTLGIQDENGNVEITSGVTAGEKVVNIGLK